MHRELCTRIFSSHLCAAAARMTELLPLEGATSKWCGNVWIPRQRHWARQKNSV